jgi:hypothetical protein
MANSTKDAVSKITDFVMGACLDCDLLDSDEVERATNYQRDGNGSETQVKATFGSPSVFLPKVCPGGEGERGEMHETDFMQTAKITKLQMLFPARSQIAGAMVLCR